MARNCKKLQPNLELRSLRLNKGLSREALGDLTGVSRETIRLAELGFVPGARAQFALADYFDMLPLDLWPIERQRIAPQKRRRVTCRSV